MCFTICLLLIIEKSRYGQISISGLSVARRNMRNSHTHFWVVDSAVENSGGKRCSDKLKNLMKCGTNFRSGSKTRLTTLSNLHTQLLASSSKAGKQLKLLKFIHSKRPQKFDETFKLFFDDTK